MKRLIIYLILVVSTCFSSYSYACDINKEAQEFALFIQDKADKEPEKFAKLTADFQKLAQDIMILSQQGNTDAICAKYKEFKTKF